ncbi:juvenile hormone esterase-like [Aethina tumida]|uniref:juvenile hormone esterase-like n=1 Tax=Aethina tumida TaxID=116153 RepID=UPI00214770C5|nr:juvenile hormone esterase-like [Aethina tumida]XP_049822482.1 juvenile hormone esterase-like [Aethina tumida]
MLAALVLFLAAVTAHQEEPIVETELGNVRGSTRLSRNGRNYFSFTGIPYARPPLGELRFKSPQKLEPWTGILDATQDASHCIQKNYLFGNPRVEGQEDCLYLNVFTPQIRPKRNVDRSELLPVMVFIHWGGFFAGYSSTDYLGPEYFMDQNVVLVTFNYRLGVMGFLSTNDDAAPGNYGLKDQVAVLNWVKANVKHFGGNSNSVTIFGQSAGGASVHYHMLSPLSKNLFHRAISQSGTAFALWASPVKKEQLLITKYQSKLVGCNINGTNTEMITCLREVKADVLVDSNDMFKLFSIDPLNVYVPSVETMTKNNPDPFITKTPKEYVENGDFRNVPWIIGLVQNEGLIRAEALIRQSQTRTELSKRFDVLMPLLAAFKMSVFDKDIPEIWPKVRRYYFQNGAVDFNKTEHVQGLIDLYTDRAFAYSSYQAALYHKYFNHKDIWFYNFDYKGTFSYGEPFAGTNETFPYQWGVSHCDELVYLFKSPALFNKNLYGHDLRMSESLVWFWTNFATLGTPKSAWLKLDNFENSTDKNLRYMNMGGCKIAGPKYKMKLGLHKDRMQFWENIKLFENLKVLNESVYDL